MKKIIIALLAIVCVSCQTAVQDNPLKDKIILFVYGGWDGHQPKQCHDFLKPWLEEQGAIVYYDPNFRANHQQDLIHLMPNMIENFEAASIIRGSNEDFGYIFGLTEADKIYNEKLKYYGLPFICTTADGEVALRTHTFGKNYPVPRIETVSTIGAGDTFNAGILFGLIHEDVYYDDLATLPEATWDKVVSYAIRFSAQVCQSYQNYVSNEFAQSVK